VLVWLAFCLYAVRLPVGLIVCLAFEVLLCAEVGTLRVASDLILSALPFVSVGGVGSSWVYVAVLLWLVHAFLAGVHILCPRSVGPSRTLWRACSVKVSGAGNTLVNLLSVAIVVLL
jgi:hypothetical protein